MTRGKLLAGSCVVAAVTAALIFNFTQRPSRNVASRQQEPPPTPSKTSPSQRAVSNPEAFNWSKIESADYREYIKNLRQIGTPEETIRDIIIADVNKLFELRRKYMMKSYPSPPGSDTRIQPFAAVKDRLKSDMLALQGEKKALIKELLGDDVFVKDDPIEIAKEDVEQVLLGFLPVEKQESANQVLRDFDGRFKAEIAPLLDGPFNPQERETYIKYKGEKDEAMKGILTASEKEQFDLRFSQLSSFLHHRFADYPLSETAFQELFRFAQKYDNELDFPPQSWRC